MALSFILVGIVRHQPKFAVPCLPVVVCNVIALSALRTEIDHQLRGLAFLGHPKLDGAVPMEMDALASASPKHKATRELVARRPPDDCVAWVLAFPLGKFPAIIPFVADFDSIPSDRMSRRFC